MFIFQRLFRYKYVIRNVIYLSLHKRRKFERSTVFDLGKKTVRDFLNKSSKGCANRSIFSRQLADYPITLEEIGTKSCHQKARILSAYIVACDITKSLSSSEARRKEGRQERLDRFYEDFIKGRK